MRIRAALAQIFMGMATALTPVGLNGAAPKLHPDTWLYRDNDAFLSQKKVLQCEGGGKRGEEKLDLSAPTDYQLRRQFTYYFDSGKVKPAYSDYFLRRNLKQFVGEKDLGVRIIGCTPQSFDRDQVVLMQYRQKNFNLSRSRIENMAQTLRDLDIAPDRICVVPQGENCDVPENSVHLETFKILKMPQDGMGGNKVIALTP